MFVLEIPENAKVIQGEGTENIGYIELITF